MKTFEQWLVERKEAGFHWPGDCNVKTIERKALTPLCYVVPGGNHDKVLDRASNATVAIVPRHRDINPYTCKSIMKDIQRSCYV